VAEDEELGRDFAEYQMSVFFAKHGLAAPAYANRASFQQKSVPVPKQFTVTPTTELIGMLLARSTQYQYQTNNLPQLQTYLRNLVEQIDVALESLD